MAKVKVKVTEDGFLHFGGLILKVKENMKTNKKRIFHVGHNKMVFDPKRMVVCNAN